MGHIHLEEISGTRTQRITGLAAGEMLCVHAAIISLRASQWYRARLI